ncbi:MAG: hypothetical protein E7519_04420 [Ruminococcaceae bacterium]|nr:hypothetical protein [Oscillospiraceae bacterium]
MIIYAGKVVKMKKKLWISILFLALLLIVVKIIFINANGKKQEPGLTASYSEETGQITVYAVRPSNQYKPYEYEGGEGIVSLSSRSVEDDTDVFVFDVLGNGIIELAFFSIDPQDPSDKYKFAYQLKGAVTDNAVSISNELWRRKQ